MPDQRHASAPAHHNQSLKQIEDAPEASLDDSQPDDITLMQPKL